MEFNVLIIVSALDEAGLNMKNHLLELANFTKETKFDPPNHWPRGSYYISSLANNGILTIPVSQIESDFLEQGVTANLLIYASKHSSKAGMKALLVHSTGNWGATFGNSGKESQLSYTPADVLYFAFHHLKIHATEIKENEYWIGFECTHHGPTSLSTPLVFIECGGTKTEWEDQEATLVVAKVILETIQYWENKIQFELPDTTAIGVGGGHYCPGFIKRVEKKMFMLGHVVPKHNHAYFTESLIDQAYIKTLGPNKFFLIDKKGTRGKDKQKFIELFEKKGYKWALTSEFPTKDI